MLLWIPLRVRPGFGTVSNIVVIGVSVDAALAVLPAAEGAATRVVYGVAGIVLNGIATAAYIGVHLGPGPRDGLMTGLAVRTGLSVGLVRTTIALTVVSTGWLLGGPRSHDCGIRPRYRAHRAGGAAEGLDGPNGYWYETNQGVGRTAIVCPGVSVGESSS